MTFKTCLGMVLVWFVYVVGIILVLFWYLVWFGYGVGMVWQ